jgi:hypothetical protein
MSIKDSMVFRDLLTHFIIEGEVPNAIMVNGQRYELMIMFDTHPQRYGIRGVHDMKNSHIEPCK